MWPNIPSIGDYYRHGLNQAQEVILQEPDSTIVGTSPEELADYHLSQYALQPIEIDAERDETIEHKKEMRWVRAHERDPMYRDEGDKKFEFESITITIPIVPNDTLPNIQNLLTSTYSLGWSAQDFTVTPNSISRKIDIRGYGFALKDDEIEREIASFKSRLQEWIDRVRNEVRMEDARFRQSIIEFLQERRKKIEADRSRMESLVAKIGMPLKKKEAEAARRVRLDPKPLIKRIKPKAKVPEEYVLDQEKVIDVIEIINNSCRQFERTPQTYERSGEEDLRNTILVGLNGVFEGRATGETFCVRGKTDIYLNIEKGNILVCECKFWEGPQLYCETINQLLGYLSWRSNYGIMITFSKRKDFSRILGEIQGAVTHHGSYNRGFRQLSSTHFLSIHRLPQDEGKAVEMHHLFYNLHVGE